MNYRLDTHVQFLKDNIGQMHHIAKYYMHIKPLKVLHVPPCVQIQHQDLASNPTLPHMQMQNHKFWGIKHVD
jgi:hypothetical protein